MKQLMQIAFLFVLFFLATLSARAAEIFITIKARPEGYWTDTGVTIKPGQKCTVTYVSGRWKPNPKWEAVDAAGNSKYTASDVYLRPGSPEGSLIGKLNGDIVGHRNEATFYVGKLSTVDQSSSGRLFLTVNDAAHAGVDGFGDNTGEIVVRVTVE